MRRIRRQCCSSGPYDGCRAQPTAAERSRAPASNWPRRAPWRPPSPAQDGRLDRGGRHHTPCVASVVFAFQPRFTKFLHHRCQPRCISSSSSSVHGLAGLPLSRSKSVVVAGVPSSSSPPALLPTIFLLGKKEREKDREAVFSFLYF